MASEALQSEMNRRLDLLQASQKAERGWKSIMAYITNLDTHGSKKPPDMSWAQYFQQALEGSETTLESLGCPPELDSADLDFQDCVLKVTAVVNEHTQTAAKRAAFYNKAATRHSAHQSREQKRMKKDAKILEACEPDQAKDESNKNFGQIKSNPVVKLGNP